MRFLRFQPLFLIYFIYYLLPTPRLNQIILLGKDVP